MRSSQPDGTYNPIDGSVKGKNQGIGVPFYDKVHKCVGPTFGFYHGLFVGARTVETAIRYSFEKMEFKPCSHPGHAFHKPPINATGKDKKKITFSWVRDPWSRVLSAAARLRVVNFSNSNPNRVEQFRRWANSPTFDKEIAFIGERLRDYTTPDMTFIGRASHMVEDVTKMCTLLGVFKPFDRYCAHPDYIPRQCARSCGNGEILDAIDSKVYKAQRDKLCTTDYYDDQLREKIANKYDDDIRTFGFKFGEVC